MKKLLTVVGMVFIILGSAGFCAELNYDTKKVDTSKLLEYPDLPDNPDKIGDKDIKKAAKKFTINHAATMGGAGGFFADILTRSMTDAKSGFSGNYCVSVRYMHWDTSARIICREVNSKMLNEEEKNKMIEEIRSKFNLYERFEIVMSYPSRWANDADISNWNIIMFDDKGNRYSPEKIEGESLTSDAALVEKRSTHETVVTNHYTVYFSSLYTGLYTGKAVGGNDAFGLPGGKVREEVTTMGPVLAEEYLPLSENTMEKIELVLAGGASEDKKLGFRWIFKTK